MEANKHVNQTENINQAEIDKFNKLANAWWQPHGPGKLLHILNKPRMDFINVHVKLNGKAVLDIGCGGGILSESLANANAFVTGIDAAPEMIAVAKQHANPDKNSSASTDTNSNTDTNSSSTPRADANIKTSTIKYAVASPEQFAQQPDNQHSFDIITCMEMLEHVDDYDSVIAACATLLKPNGVVFFSTLNRTPTAYLLAILGAEYILQLLPKQTHDYHKFIKPTELAGALAKHGLILTELKGIKYNPLLNQASLVDNVHVNYLAYATRA